MSYCSPIIISGIPKRPSSLKSQREEERRCPEAQSTHPDFVYQLEHHLHEGSDSPLKVLNQTEVYTQAVHTTVTTSGAVSPTLREDNVFVLWRQERGFSKNEPIKPCLGFFPIHSGDVQGDFLYPNHYAGSGDTKNNKGSVDPHNSQYRGYWPSNLGCDGFHNRDPYKMLGKRRGGTH